MRLGNTVGNRINTFDNLETQTVETFNELFPECPIRDTDYELEVSIGGPESNNCRTIFVDSVLTMHKMYSDMLYTLDRELYHLDERDLELESINGVTL